MNKTEEISVDSTPDHCGYCFDVVLSALENKNSKTDEFLPLPSTIKDHEAPVFVSWHKNSSELRGCIGTFIKKPLSENLPKFAIQSAFEDSRFDPISKSEIPSLLCGVSLLTNFERDKDPYDWEVGQHGIIIELDYDDERYRATYLPDVAQKRGWSKDETLKHLLRKSGCDAQLKHVVKDIKLERYQTSQCEISYEEYLKIKKI